MRTLKLLLSERNKYHFPNLEADVLSNTVV